ncbi:MAG: outer membrane protein assembly factor BamE [Aestuariivita sp.]|nr:outer membrane protein assembly factor BamE [Aestuariivita sp.]MCY4203286.1 outer membrane protein assembly factor BamE [Aestuariivita sp.]MCY4287187.1 outer membrane protein assembly factor BamE [Aestuariivita sp.]MCY4347505.1 outer membrane protein assembly factor BamE [Aestuariivita sp.]
MTKFEHLLYGLLRTGFAIVLLVLLAACSDRFRNHGFAPTDEELAVITVGVDTRESVEAEIGSGSFSDVLDQGTNFYLHSKVQLRGLQAPKVVKRRLVAIDFDSNDLVANIDTYDLSDGQAVLLTRRVTDSSVSNRGFLRQLLGNLGRIDPEDLLQ